MAARADTTLTDGKLRAFTDALMADRSRSFAEKAPTFRRKGDRRSDYEDHRDLALLAGEAIRDGRQIFEPAKVIALAEEAGIERNEAEHNLAPLQEVMAHNVGLWNVDMAETLRPAAAKPSLLDTLIGRQHDRQDVAFDAVRWFLVGRVKAPLADEARVQPDIAGSAPCAHTGEAGPTSNIEAQAKEPERHAANAPAPELDAVDDREALSSGDDGVRTGDGDANDLAVGGSSPPTQLSSTFAIDLDLAPVGELVDASVDDLGLSATTLANHADWDGRFSTMWGDFTASKLDTEGWSESRRPELAATLRILLRVLGDVSALTLTREQAGIFRKKFCKLPVDHKNLWFDYKENKQRTYDEVISYAVQIEAETGKPLNTVHPKTWNKHCGTLSAAIRWLKVNRDAGKHAENVFKGLHLPIKKTAAAIRLEREMATTVSLKALFRTEVWTGRRSSYHLTGRGNIIIRDSLYWVPLIETCQGMRREEACQLRGRHVRNKFGILGFDLFCRDLRVKETEGASRRFIPLSKVLLELGFVDAVLSGRDRDELLFPELTNDNAHGAYGVSYGKRFLNYIDRVEPDFMVFAAEACAPMDVSDDERAELIVRERDEFLTEFKNKTNNHAIRHWFKTEAENAGCKTMFVEELMGHAYAEQKTEGGRYMKEVFVRNLKLTIDMVPMPFNSIELRRLAEEAVNLR